MKVKGSGHSAGAAAALSMAFSFSPSIIGESKHPSRSGPMQRLMVAINRLAGTEEGQDLIEYAMLVALIALAAVVAVTRVGSTINAVLWQAIAASNY
jgi:Flp pilus assembly pilin Flp